VGRVLNLFFLMTAAGEEQHGTGSEENGYDRFERAMREQCEQPADCEGERDVHGERPRHARENVQRPIAAAEHDAGQSGLVGQFSGEHYGEAGQRDSEAHPAILPHAAERP